MFHRFLIIFLIFVTAQPGSSLFEGIFDKLGYIGNVLDNAVNLPIGIVKFLHESYEFDRKETIDTDIKNGSEYDFIIVGAGSAGAIIASRLTEISGTTVLLIEAGGKEYFPYDIPISAPALQALPMNWNDATEPSNDYCTAFTNNQCPIPHGKVMGGTSTLNFQLTSRGTPDDFDHWASLGNDGWSYNDILKYFKKIENYTANAPGTIDELRGKNGPIPVQFPTFVTTIGKQFIKAGEEMGFVNHDYNSNYQTSFSQFQVNTDNNERYSTNRGYLQPARERENLSVTRHSMAEKILIDKTTNKAYGILFEKNSKKVTAIAKKEVIVCAGSINSPHLLMLSGLGPKEHLQEMQIDVVKNVPGVGENFMDHISVNGLVITVNTTDTGIFPYWFTPFDTTFSDYFNRRDGFLGSHGFESGGFVDINNATYRGGKNNIEIFQTYFSVWNDLVIYKVLGIKDEFAKQFRKLTFKHCFQILPALLQPESRGKLSLRSNNPKDRPKIVPNYYATKYDVERLIKAVRYIQKLLKTKAFQEINAELYSEPIKGCEKYIFNTDDYWECHMRTYPLSFWHYVGTVKMGPESDPMAVVDSRLKFYGIDALRVADASIFPMTIRAHTNFASMMVGEKAADMIKEDWQLTTI